jgi:hypothetical protein
MTVHDYARVPRNSEMNVTHVRMYEKNEKKGGDKGSILPYAAFVFFMGLAVVLLFWLCFLRAGSSQQGEVVTFQAYAPAPSPQSTHVGEDVNVNSKVSNFNFESAVFQTNEVVERHKYEGANSVVVMNFEYMGMQGALHSEVMIPVFNEDGKIVAYETSSFAAAGGSSDGELDFMAALGAQPAQIQKTRLDAVEPNRWSSELQSKGSRIDPKKCVSASTYRVPSGVSVDVLALREEYDQQFMKCANKKYSLMDVNCNAYSNAFVMFCEPKDAGKTPYVLVTNEGQMRFLNAQKYFRVQEQTLKALGKENAFDAQNASSLKLHKKKC